MVHKSDNTLRSKDNNDDGLCHGCTHSIDLAHYDLGALPDDEIIYKATQIFSALADSTRFKILASLAGGELCVHELQELCGVTQSAVSHQLRLLRDIDLVRYRREGQRAVYRLADDHVLSMLKLGIEHASEE